jgi:hypothetical protein
MAVMARLSPGGVDAASPYLADYARDRVNWPKMRALFSSQPALEPNVLVALAKDAQNAEAVVGIASASQRKPDAIWLNVLLSSLVNAGDYGRARGIWASVGRGSNSGLIYDPSFSSPTAPPPFNWLLASSTIGLAERQPGTQLHGIFYGNVDGPLASQLLTLSPGAYMLRIRLVGAPVNGETLRWSVRCNKSNEPFSLAPIAQVAARGLTFNVPANCPAQWLELSGRAGDVAQQSEATLTALSLSRATAND